MILIVCSHVLQKEMTDEEFTSYKTALVEQKLERDHSLLDETDRHWEQIWDQRYEAHLCQE
jgi:secreted Zn-dependent insulinase-like peptidase